MNPLHRLLLAAMKDREWRAANLRAAIEAEGLTISLQAVCYWLEGGGVADKHRAPLARALGVPYETLLLAAGGVETDAASPDPSAVVA